MSKIARFISSDAAGTIHEVEHGSVAFELMSKDGGFVRLYSDEEVAAFDAGEPIITDAPREIIEEPEPVDLSKMNKAQLVAEAESRGVAVVPDEMTKAQIIDAIEAGEPKE